MAHNQRMMLSYEYRYKAVKDDRNHVPKVWNGTESIHKPEAEAKFTFITFTLL